MIIFSIGRRFKNFIRLKIYGRKKKYLHSDSDSEKRGLKNGHQKMYYKSGNLKADLMYKNGNLEGIAIMFYENGSIKAKEFYRENQLQGLSKWYYESGELKSEKYFKDGNLTESKEYDKSGKLIA